MFQYSESIFGGLMAFRNGKHVGWVLTTDKNQWTFQLRSEKTDEPRFETQDLAKAALEEKVSNQPGNQNE